VTGIFFGRGISQHRWFQPVQIRAGSVSVFYVGIGIGISITDPRVDDSADWCFKCVAIFCWRTKVSFKI